MHAPPIRPSKEINASEAAPVILVVAIMLRFLAAAATFACVIDKCNHGDEVFKLRRLAMMVGGANFVVMSAYFACLFAYTILAQSRNSRLLMSAFFITTFLFLGMTAKLAHKVLKCHRLQSAKKLLMSLLAVQEWAILFGTLGFALSHEESNKEDLELTVMIATIALGLSTVWYMLVACFTSLRNADRFRICLDEILPWKLTNHEQIVRLYSDEILDLLSKEPFPLGDFYVEGSFLGNGTYGHVRQYNLNNEIIRKHCLSRGCKRNNLIDAVRGRLESSDYYRVAVKEFTRYDLAKLHDNCLFVQFKCTSYEYKCIVHSFQRE